MSSSQMALLLMLLSAGPARADCRTASCLRMEAGDAIPPCATAALPIRRTGHGGLQPSEAGGTRLNLKGNGLGLRTPAGLCSDRAASG